MARVRKNIQLPEWSAKMLSDLARRDQVDESEVIRTALRIYHVIRKNVDQCDQVWIARERDGTSTLVIPI